jgi:D-alanyl-D-alanine carboxypeptidase
MFHVAPPQMRLSFKPTRLFSLIVSLLVAGLLVVATFDAADARPKFSAISVDARTGKILFANDIDGQRHPASLTKVMTLYLLFQDLQAERIKLSTNLQVSRRAASMAPSKLGMKPGSTISVENAIKALVTKSANDVAATIGENLGGSEANFAARMTRTARAIGMSRTTFKNASGLPNPSQTTTARDMATLSLRVQRDFPQYYPYFRITSFTYNGKTIRTHNRLLGRYRGTDGIKTGYIAASGFNLTTSAKRGDKRIVGVVMGSSSGGARNKYMMNMLDKTFAKCVDGKTIATAAGSSKSADEPLAGEKKIADAKAKLKPLFGNKVEEPVVAEAPAETPVTENAGTTFQTVTAPGDAPSADATKVLVAKIEDMAEEPDEESESDVANMAPETSTLPSKLPFAVKKNEDTTSVATVDPTWNIQIGAYPKKEEARKKLQQVKASNSGLLEGKPAFTVEVQKGDETVYRARFSGFTQKTAKAACSKLARKGLQCMTLSPQS